MGNMEHLNRRKQNMTGRSISRIQNLIEKMPAIRESLIIYSPTIVIFMFVMMKHAPIGLFMWWIPGSLMAILKGILRKNEKFLVWAQINKEPPKEKGTKNLVQNYKYKRLQVLNRNYYERKRIEKRNKNA